MVGIYKIENKINGMIYIGQSNNLERRYKEHFSNISSNQWIDKDIKEKGKENFNYEVIEYCDILELDEREKYWINYYNSFNNGYNQTLGGPHHYQGRPKLLEKDIIAIRTAYANHENRDEVYENYKDKITKNGFYSIWQGRRWTSIMPEVYSEENKTFHKNKAKFLPGGNHPGAYLTDEEVIKIRERYVNETAKQIWEDYKDKYSLGSFKQILIGVKYSHLPIYKKVEKRWINV